jgi:hypothetical protein
MSYLNKTAFTHLLGNDNLNALSLLDSINQHMEKKAFFGPLGHAYQSFKNKSSAPAPAAPAPAAPATAAPGIGTPTTAQAIPEIPKDTFMQWLAKKNIPIASTFAKPVAILQATDQAIGQVAPSAGSISDFIKSAPNKGAHLFSNLAGSLGAGEGVQNLVGKYALPALSIAALTALASGKKKNAQPAAGAGAPVINIHNNPGDRRQRLLSDNPDVGSLSSYKYASFLSKKADMITDTLVNVAKNRVANNMLDKMVSKKPKDDSEKSKNKEVELVSKNPKIKKLLDNEENKQYLEKLITEKA